MSRNYNGSVKKNKNFIYRSRTYNLGPLEQEIMECIWSIGNCTVSDIYQCLIQRRQIAYTTIMTIMTRLTEKRFLSRKFIGKSYLYSPIDSKSKTLRNTVFKVIEVMINRFGSEAVAYFAEELEKFPNNNKI